MTKHRTNDSKTTATSKPSAPEGGKAPATPGAKAAEGGPNAGTANAGQGPNAGAPAAAGAGAGPLGQRHAPGADPLSAPRSGDPRPHTDPANIDPNAGPEAGRFPVNPGPGPGSTDQPGEGSRNPEQAAINRDLNNPPAPADAQPGRVHPNDPMLHVGNETRPNAEDGGVDLPGKDAAAAAANLPPAVPVEAQQRAAQQADMTPVQAYPDEQTITMVSPREFYLLLDGHRGRVKFAKGTQEVPTSLQNHRYVLDHGVKPYEKK